MNFLVTVVSYFPWLPPVSNHLTNEPAFTQQKIIRISMVVFSIAVSLSVSLFYAKCASNYVSNNDLFRFSFAQFLIKYGSYHDKAFPLFQALVVLSTFSIFTTAGIYSSIAIDHFLFEKIIPAAHQKKCDRQSTYSR